MKFNYQSRIRLISFGIFIFALVIIVRLYFLQIVDNDFYISKADKQYTSTAQKIFSRGSIFFQNKDGSLVSAATLKSGYIVAVNPEILKDPEFAYQKLNEIIPIDRAHFITTIEPTVQMYLQSVLKNVTEKYSSDSTGGIIMDPSTGEIYAMETYPTFDPNRPDLEKSSAIFSNPLVENVYEMGSVINPLTISAGIDAGVVTAKTTYYDKGFTIISGKKVSNFDSKERGIVSLQDVLSQSLNVGAAYVQSLLGNKLFSEYMLGFSLADRTGIDFPNEGRNLVTNLKSNIDINLATASFGQGIALTPITTIRALSVIANGGDLVEPHTIKSIKYKIGVTKTTPITIGARVIKRETSEEVTRMLIYSVDNVLSGGSYRMPNYSIAVKTGTAQMVKPGGGGYEEDKFLHSFVGYFPAYNPKFIIFLYTINPKGARFGSETLTVPFMDTVKFLINYYEIPPDR